MHARVDAPEPERDSGPPADTLPITSGAAPRVLDRAAFSDFLSSLAHDMRSPMSVVALALTELRANVAGKLSPEDLLLVAFADRGLQRLGQLASTVSLAAFLEPGDVTLDLLSTDLIALVRGAVDAAVALEPRREITLVCALPSEPFLVRADAIRLASALSTMVTNAIRHARANVRVSLERRGGAAIIAVEDDGRGVPPAARASLFERFVQRPSRSGLGIALSLANDVVIAHGGSVALEASELPAGRPGSIGARFEVSLPAEPAV